LDFFDLAFDGFSSAWDFSVTIRRHVVRLQLMHVTKRVCSRFSGEVITFARLIWYVFALFAIFGITLMVFQLVVNHDDA
jgi:hypothetical protein